MSNETLQSILTQHAIPSAYWPEMRELVFDSTGLARNWSIA